MSVDADSDPKMRMVAWHSACMEWVLSAGEELPEWARGVSGREATIADARRLSREARHRTLFGTADAGTRPRGLLDFIEDGH